MKDYLRLRTFIVLGVIAVFAYAMHPLAPQDFYKVFRTVLKDDMSKLQGEKLIADAQKLQQKDKSNPAAALLKAAEKKDVDLQSLTTIDGVSDNSEVISRVRQRASGSIRLGLDLNGGVEFILGLQPDSDALAAAGVSQEEANRKLSENFNEYRDLAMEALRKRLEKQNILKAK